MKALSIAATGMMAQQTNVNVISNNIANANTTGFKSSRAAFQDLIYQSMQREGALTSEAGTARPVGIDIGLGVQTAGTVRLNTQGGMLATENSLNVAIDGRGYFSVLMPDGSQAYTRDGALKRNGEGLIVTSDGFPVSPEIVIPEDARSISINPDGEVYAYFALATEAQLLGQFSLTGFSNAKGLEAIGGNLFTETEASGPALVTTPGQNGLGTLRQGYLEDSSVDPVREITELIEAQRGYELNSKVISAADQMLGATTQIR